MPCASRFSKLAAHAAAPPFQGQTYSRRAEHNRRPMTSPKRLGVVMDPIGAINYAKDSTLAMLLAAQKRGLALSYLELQDLSLRDGVAWGRLRPLSVRADSANWFTLGEPR